MKKVEISGEFLSGEGGEEKLEVREESSGNDSPAVAFKTTNSGAYRKGKLDPSLQPDSAERRCRSREGIRSEKRASPRTLADRTGSVGVRQAAMMKAVFQEASNRRWMMTVDTSHPNTMLGPMRIAMLFQCRLMYAAGRSIAATNT